MYHWVVKQRITEVMRRLNERDFAFVLSQFAPDAEHWFSGRHALSGTRRSSAERERWYERLGLVFNRITFAPRKIAVSGWPWNTVIVVEWADRVFDARGDELEPNQGVFVITLAWGKVKEFHVYCDTQGLERNLEVIARRGEASAALPPITDHSSPRMNEGTAAGA